MSKAALVTMLLSRGDIISIERGLLEVVPASGKHVPKKWLSGNRVAIVTEILRKTGQEGIVYSEYTAGRYGHKLASGVTLQFKSVLEGAEAYAIFNADLNRKRYTKHGRPGDPLPKGQFHVAKRSGFCKFWASTGLPARRLSCYYEHMGKLKPLFFESQNIANSDNRLHSSSLRPLHISCHEIKVAFGLTDSAPTTDLQSTDKQPIVATDKETLQPSKTLDLQPGFTTGESYCGKTVIREKVTRGNVHPSIALAKAISNIPIYEYENPGIREWLIDVVIAELEEHDSYKSSLG